MFTILKSALCQTWPRLLFQQLLTKICLLCGERTEQDHHFCIDCYNDLPIVPETCRQCGVQLFNAGAKCGACLLSTPPFDLTFARFPYVLPVPYLIHALKFKGLFVYAQTLASFFHEMIPIWYARLPLPNLLVPIPLHTQRLRERGFNQTLLIAKALNRKLNLPLDLRGLSRVKNTRRQSELTSNERRQNLQKAFQTRRSYKGLTVALIDDVMTTGYTVKAASLQLKKAGAKAVHVWCMARRL